MTRRLNLYRYIVVAAVGALAWAACTTIDFATIDWDGDGVPDQNDAFPVDPNEDTDTDGDGVGDNSDAFPQDPNRSAPIDNANDNALPQDNGNTNDNQNDNGNQNVNDNQNDNGTTNPPTGGRR